jgi:hypothetical protein
MILINDPLEKVLDSVFTRLLVGYKVGHQLEETLERILV